VGVGGGGVLAGGKGVAVDVSAAGAASEAVHPIKNDIINKNPAKYRNHFRVIILTPLDKLSAVCYNNNIQAQQPRLPA
jgi:hypothetical protein